MYIFDVSRIGIGPFIIDNHFINKENYSWPYLPMR